MRRTYLPPTYRHHVYEITESDVNKPVVRVFGKVYLVVNEWGRTMSQDIGKRVYLRRGILQIESSEQLARRLGNVT